MRIHRILPAILAVALLPAFAVAADLATLIRSGDRVAALAEIRGGADVNPPLDDGSSPLLWAVYRLDQELVDELLRHGARPDARNVLGATPLTQAIELGERKLAESLLAAGADPDLGNEDDQTPLMLAARGGSLPVVEALLKAGAKVNTREKYRGQTALMWAIGANSPAVVDLLIGHQAEVDIRSAVNDWGNQITSEPRAQYRPAGGLTPLLYATRSGCLECVKSLLAAGADINRPTPEGVTPLMNAIDNGRQAVASLLLDQGADPHLSDWWGRTAIYLSVDMNTRGQNSTLPLTDRLLRMGVDPDVRLNMHRPFRGRFTDDLMTTGCTPLLRAALSMDHESVALLLAHGALPDLPNVMGVTPLIAAAGIGVGGEGSGSSGVMPAPRNDSEAVQGKSIKVMELLLEAGADVNARITDTSSRTAVIARPSTMTDRQGQTALFGAISRDWPRVARFLLEHGARTDVKDSAGKTLLDALAAQAGGRDKPSGEEMMALIRQAVGAT